MLSRNSSAQVLSILLFLPALALAQPPAPLTLQQVLHKARIAAGAPGASAAIMQDGEIVWSGSSGIAAPGVPATDATLYSLASVTKTFTSTMVLRLYEEHRLGIDDPIAPYVPGYVPDSDIVTIRDLLGMTSGYPDAENDPAISLWLLDPNHRWGRPQVLSRIQPVRYPPGSEYYYANSNYVALGAVIDQVSPLGVGGEFDRLIAGPLGLDSSACFERRPACAPRIAHGYDVRNGQVVDTFQHAELLGVPTGIWGVMWTDGGLAATASGVARFTDALFGGSLLQPATLKMMIQPGPHTSYGLGTYALHFDNHAWQGNDGFYYGFTAVTMYDFQRRLTITVLTNLTSNGDPAYRVWDRLVKAYDRMNSASH
jgi:D-alanyl-D-alanine carboxypeptidase